jgi:two-component system C4-dicarboxylate transport response regulator DctD
MFEGYKIIFVEDDPAVRSSVAETLDLAGFVVEPYESAERALPAIVAGLPGIVITDVRLPGMDGFGLLQRICATDATIPVILVTGHGDVSMAVEAMRHGAYDFIEKPFAMERLVEVVTRAVEKRSLRLEVDTLRRKLVRHRRHAGRRIARHAPAAPANPEPGRYAGRRAGVWRNRHRQGSGGALPARAQQPPPRQLCRHQLRRLAGNPV